MATNEVPTYDPRQTQTFSWRMPVIVNVIDDEAAAVDNLMSRRTLVLKVATSYRQRIEQQEYTITVKQAVIDHLEEEVRGLEHANALHLEVINKQAALIKSYETQLIALTAADSELTPAYSATDNLG